jgi:hypothetical protein
MDLTDPQQIHGYTYANNNPLTYADPTGMMYIPVRPDIQSPGSVSSGQKPPKPSAPSSSGSSAPVSSSSANTAYYNGSSSNGISLVSYDSGVGLPIDPFEPLDAFEIDAGDWFSTLADIFVPDPREAISDCRHDFVSLGCGSLLFDLAPTLRGLKRGAEALDEAGDAARRTDNAADAAQCNSFVPGTHVLMADGSTKPIEDVQIGDEVLATDPDTGETSPRTVTAEIEGTGTKHLTTLTIKTDDDHTTTLTSTAGHPYWTPDNRTWTNAEDLNPGDRLAVNDGTAARVTSVHDHTRYAAVHNLTVEDIHTYHVLAGVTPVLAHNASPGCGAERWTSQTNLDDHFERHGADMGFDNVTEYRYAAEDLMCECAGRRPGVIVKRDGTTSYFLDSETGEFGIRGSRGIVTYYIPDNPRGHFENQPGAIVP